MEGDDTSIADDIARRFERDIIGSLAAYTEIECVSPAYDPQWRSRGEIDRAAAFLARWVEDCAIANCQVEIVRIADRTPVLFVEIGATDVSRSTTTTLIYGHFDKQPPFSGWRADLDPFRAVRQGDRVYGRGTADDGYAVFAACAAVGALRHAERSHGRIVILIEASEESGSPDLDAYLDLLARRIGAVGLVVCLDSGCLTYDRLWVTTSFRGNLSGTLEVEVLTEAMHSGLAGGIVPSSFRIARNLLSRLEDAATGEMLLDAFRVAIPARRIDEINAIAEEFGSDGAGSFPTVTGLRLIGDNAVDRIINNTWRGSLAVTGADGFPRLEQAGNVLRPVTALKLSFRTPPSADPDRVVAEIAAVLTTDPPYGAAVKFVVDHPARGWDAPIPAAWLTDATEFASTRYFGSPPGYFGLGATIPFMASLGVRFFGAQFVATGVLGPESNAHGPNEFLHLPTARAVTATVAHLLAVAPGLGTSFPGAPASFATVSP